MPALGYTPKAILAIATRLTALLVLLCGVALGQTSHTCSADSNCTTTGNNTHSGSETFTGGVLPKAIDSNTLYVTRFGGLDFCAKLAAAIAQAISNNGSSVNATIDARGIVGQQTCTSATNPFASVGGDVALTVLLPGSTIVVDAQWYTNSSGVIVKGMGSDQTWLRANGTTFPTGTPLIKVGDGTAKLIFSTRFEDLSLDCNNVTNCQTFLGSGLSEFSGLKRVNTQGTHNSTALAQIDLNETAVSMGHWTLEELQLADAGANDGISVHGAGQASMADIKHVTCNNTASGITGLACVHVNATTTAGLTASTNEIHAEGFGDTVYSDGYASVSGAGFDCTGTCTNVIHINSPYMQSFLGIRSSGGTNIVKNDVNSCTVARSGEHMFSGYLQTHNDTGRTESYLFGAAAGQPSLCSNNAPEWLLKTTSTTADGTKRIKGPEWRDGDNNGWDVQYAGDATAKILQVYSVTAGTRSTNPVFTLDNNGGSGDVTIGLAPNGAGAARIQFKDSTNALKFQEYLHSDGTFHIDDGSGNTRVQISTGSTVLNGVGNNVNLQSGKVLVSTTGGVDMSAGTGGLKLKDQGQCTMAAGTCTAQSLGHTYAAAPFCVVTWTGTGTLTGILKAPSTTTTTTPASSVGTDTAQVNWACFGN